MPDLPLTLNGLHAISVRLSIPWRGVWCAEVELDGSSRLAAIPILSAETPAILVAGNRTLLGTIDPKRSGTFANRVTAFVVGGHNGWSKEVPGQHFAGVAISTAVYAATAALVLEPPPVDPFPVPFGTHYGRTKGPAHKVFGDRDWFVQLDTGIVLVSVWPPIPMLPDVIISDYDVAQRRVMVNAQNIISPGTTIVDERFGATALTVRDVVQTFDSAGSHAELWCSENPVSRLQEGLTRFIREAAETSYLRTYKYRFVLGTTEQLALQAITPGAPDLNPIEQWTGLSGIKAMLQPATEIVVGFAGGDPSQPYIVSFSPLATPIALFVNASTVVNVGIPTSPVALSVGTQAQIAALQTEIAAIAAALNAQAAAGWTEVTATSTMAPAITAAVTAGAAAVAAGVVPATSTKLLSQ